MTSPMKLSDRLVVVLAAVILLATSLSYLYYSWNHNIEVVSSESVMLAESIESMVHPDHISDLRGSLEDIGNPDYDLAKNSLINLVDTTDMIHFAYFIALREEQVVILMDSELPDSPDYSPPGQVFSEADEVYLRAFRSDQTILTDKTVDRWGEWKSVLVPVIDPENGDTVAVFGLDFPFAQWQARIWKQMIPDIIIVAVVDILFLFLLFIWNQRDKLRILSNRLSADEAMYHSVFDQAPIGIAIVSDKRFLKNDEFGNLNINSRFEQILGRKQDVLSTIKWPEITHPDDLKRDLELFSRFKSGEISGYSLEKRFIRPDGSYVWTNMTISPFSGAKSRDDVHICLLEDITEQKRANEAVTESERSKSVLLSHLPGMAYRCSFDPEWTMMFVSDGCYRLTGYEAGDLIDNRKLSYNDLIAPEFRDILWKEWSRLLPEKQPLSHEYEIITASGERKWVLELGEGVYAKDGSVEALEGIVIDISDRKRAEASLIYINEHDRWTGLYNRYYLERMLSHEFSLKDKSKSALIEINISSIQSLTEIYGFHYSQELTRDTSDELRKFCSSDRVLFMTNWDRFVFYIRKYGSAEELEEFCAAVTDALTMLLGPERIGAGIGVIEIDRDITNDTDQLLKKLLIASERAAQNNEKEFSVCFYNEEMESFLMREEAIKREMMRLAYDEDDKDLFLQFQPVYDVKTDKISGFEALARIRSEKLGMIPPLDFIPIAEKTKLIIPLGRKIIIKAFKFINKLNASVPEDISVSINISAIQLLSPGFVDFFLSDMKDMGIGAEKVGIEITESVFSDDFDEINRIIAKLKDLGVSIAIDDFGTGYSSLARERELNVSCLKIDKFFIDKLQVIEPSMTITSDIISIAHKLGHYTVAEGVEHKEQMNYLVAHGCDKIQGFFISRPLDEDAAIGMIVNVSGAVEVPQWISE